MKNLVAVFVLLLPAFKMNAGVLVVEGKFQNRNIYVQNAYGGSGVGFCALEVKVNGNITTDEVNSSSFEIDLKALQLKYNDNVTIEILHKDFCKPRVLNAEDLRPRPTYELMNMKVNSTGVLEWTTVNETGTLPYIVEQFKWNKWVKVGEVVGVGTPDMHEYQFKVPAHSGENKFRIKQIGLDYRKVSKEVIYSSVIERPNYALTKHHDALQFSCETAYEVYDDYGIIKKGFGKEIDLRNLKKGRYYLCFDNQTTEFQKKKK